MTCPGPSVCGTIIRCGANQVRCRREGTSRTYASLGVSGSLRMGGAGSRTVSRTGQRHFSAPFWSVSGFAIHRRRKLVFFQLVADVAAPGLHAGHREARQRGALRGAPLCTIRLHRAHAGNGLPLFISTATPPSATIQIAYRNRVRAVLFGPLARCDADGQRLWCPRRAQRQGSIRLPNRLHRIW